MSSDVNTLISSKLSTTDAETLYAPVQERLWLQLWWALSSGSIGGNMTVDTTGTAETSASVTAGTVKTSLVIGDTAGHKDDT